MVYVKLDDTIIPFIVRGIPLSFYYDLYKGRTKNGEGNLRIGSLITNIDKFDKISIIIGDNVIPIDYSSKNIIQSVDNSIVIDVHIDDIFKLYERVNEAMMKWYVDCGRVYVCCDTSMNCNLACPYCCVGSNIKKVYPKTNLVLADYYMRKLYNIVKSQLKSVPTSIRVIGGEPFLDMNEFDNVLNNAIRISQNNIDELWVYSNFTINIEAFSKYIDKLLELYPNLHICCTISTDSLNPKKSMRMPSEKLIQSHKNNIKLFADKYINNPNIFILFNCMYIDDNEVIDTAKYFKSNGILNYQISLDENRISEDDVKFNKSVHYRLNKKLQNELGMIRFKPNYGQTLSIFFSIRDEYNDVMRIKRNYKVDYTVQPSLDF